MSLKALSKTLKRPEAHLLLGEKGVLGCSQRQAAPAALNLLQGNHKEGGLLGQVDDPAVQPCARVWAGLVHIPGEARHLKGMPVHQLCCLLHILPPASMWVTVNPCPFCTLLALEGCWAEREVRTACECLHAAGRIQVLHDSSAGPRPQ